MMGLIKYWQTDVSSNANQAEQRGPELADMAHSPLMSERVLEKYDPVAPPHIVTSLQVTSPLRMYIYIP